MSVRACEVAVIVLAAGRGTRFGETPKLLAMLDGKPLVRHVVDAALGLRPGEVVVVLGHRAGEVRQALGELDIRFVGNPDFAQGLSTSLKAGFAAVSPGTRAVLVCLGDMPRVGSDLLGDLVTAWRAAGDPDAVVPVHRGRRGNPVLLAARLAPEIARLEGDAGAGRLLRARANVVEMPVAGDCVLLDVDTPDALRQASTTPSSTAE